MALGAEGGHVTHHALIAERHSKRHGGAPQETATAAAAGRLPRRHRGKYVASTSADGSTINCEPLRPNAITGLPRTNSTKKRNVAYARRKSLNRSPSRIHGAGST